MRCFEIQANIFILKVIDEPLGKPDSERRVKKSLFQKKVPKDIFIAKFKNLPVG